LPGCCWIARLCVTSWSVRCIGRWLYLYFNTTCDNIISITVPISNVDKIKGWQIWKWSCMSSHTGLLSCSVSHLKIYEANVVWQVECEGFWRWCITLSITGFVDFDRRPRFQISTKHDVSETASISVFSWGEGDSYSVGPIRKSWPQSS
jgi:hypothetical protein